MHFRSGLVVAIGLVAASVLVAPHEAFANHREKYRSQCADFGFQEGTDGFANCMLQLTLKNKGDEHPDHDTLVERYGKLSRDRQGDDRYPVCSAGMMENELDTMQNKWVGPNCQLAAD